MAAGATVALGGTTLLTATTFDTGPGEVWCVTGGIGTGKTTLLRAFLGSLGLTAGPVPVRGQRAGMTKPAHRRCPASLAEPMPVARDTTAAAACGRQPQLMISAVITVQVREAVSSAGPGSAGALAARFTVTV
ncbi:ATP-binding cassette domain-containing protein [Streptomyces fumanus]|uniref:ATP-binding cassette domain-containing protein n=1 Tax=Streptomyces fumanus TaxID=67302 RepID=UPI0033DDE795